MLRSEYDRFLEIAQQELDPDYFVQNTYTDPEYYNIFTRIRKNGTFFDQPTYQEFNFHKGIFIDIFPLDNLPGNWCQVRREFSAFVRRDFSGYRQKKLFETNGSDFQASLHTIRVSL